MVERISGLKIYRKLPFGLDPIDDIKFVLRDYQIKMIFDVGANIGQSAKVYRSHFPSSEIHCFEPIADTYELLLEGTKNLNATCHKLALGSQNMDTEIKIDIHNCDSVMNSLVDKNQDERISEFKTEQVNVVTLADFCKSNNVQHIDYLKIDTEGFDLEVLKGGEGLLEKNAIDLISTEVSMNSYNTYHVDFIKIKKYLEDLGYVVFGIYHQVREWRTGKPILRTCDVLFISEKLANDIGRKNET